MKKIGIVGGIAWRSTVEYYAALCRRAEEWHFARKLPGLPSMPETDDAAERMHKSRNSRSIDSDTSLQCVWPAQSYLLHFRN